MSASKLPFRTEVHTASVRELAAVNEERVKAGLAPFAPAEEEITRISSFTVRGANKPSEELLSSLLAHPDERVPLALLRQGVLKGHYASFRRVLYRRAVAEVDSESICWNPLLDAMDEQGPWPDALRTTAAEDSYRIYPARTLLYELHRWVVGQSDEAGIMRLAPFKGPTLLELVASWSPIITKRMALEMFLTEPISISALITNRNTTDDIRILVLPPALKALRTGDRGAQYKYAKTLNDLSSSLSGSLPTEAIAEILSWLLASDESLAKRTRRELVEALSRSDLTTEQAILLVRYLSGYASGSYHAVARIIKNVVLPGEMYDFICEHFLRSINIRDALAECTEALSRPRVRAALESSSSVKVLYGLTLSAAPKEYRAYVLRLMKRSMSRLPELFGASSVEQLSSLQQRDIVPLLSSPKEDLRLAAIRVAGLTQRSS